MRAPRQPRSAGSRTPGPADRRGARRRLTRPGPAIPTSRAARPCVPPAPLPAEPPAWEWPTLTAWACAGPTGLCQARYQQQGRACRLCAGGGLGGPQRATPPGVHCRGEAYPAASSVVLPPSTLGTGTSGLRQPASHQHRNGRALHRPIQVSPLSRRPCPARLTRTTMRKTCPRPMPVRGSTRASMCAGPALRRSQRTRETTTTTRHLMTPASLPSTCVPMPPQCRVPVP